MNDTRQALEDARKHFAHCQERLLHWRREADKARGEVERLNEILYAVEIAPGAGVEEDEEQ